MTNQPVKLFYSYAPEDTPLRARLEIHLKLLSRQGYISEWHNQMIEPGTLWKQQIDSQLKEARVILLLISPDFIASDYCYGVELQEAMKRHQSGEAKVIPILLRQCDWKSAPFGELQALPRNGKPVRMWPDKDVAFTEIVQEIRTIIDGFNGHIQDTTTQQVEGTYKKQRKAAVGIGDRENMQNAPKTPVTSQTLSTPLLKKAIDRYYRDLKEFEGKADYEMAVRSAFQSLLAESCRLVKWTLIPEQMLEGGIRPDGVIRDDYFVRGYWESKGPKSDLNKEIIKKIADKYPLTNTLFENTRIAVLYQNNKRVPYEYNLAHFNDVSDLLKQFVSYTKPEVANFDIAVSDFKERIPEQAKEILKLIESEYKRNNKFIAAFSSFRTLCQNSLNPKISDSIIKEMLVQHLLTERLFRTIFDNSNFVNRNVIATEVEKVIQALTSREFISHNFLSPLDRFYVAIEYSAKNIDSWSERQYFLNNVYERFFQGFSVKQADTLGIVYTPQEIVDFMCESVEEVLQREFGTSIADPGVKILDPATGTGSFIVNLLHRIPRHQLKYKYQHDLFCNEVTLLPYYIASLNIEHEYFERFGEYEPFEGICFADTLELAEGQQLPLFVEENTERVQHEKDARIMVVIGNPPYNVGQKNESDNNKNRSYPIIDQHINQSYAKDSNATLNNKLYDAYVRFFRWATDRLQGRDGIVCYVTNNSFVDQIAFDGMRKNLLKDFNQIYHLDLHGNVRKNPKLSGTTHNVFGIQIGVGITVAIRSSKIPHRSIYYYRVPEYWVKKEKLSYLEQNRSISKVEWVELQPDSKFNWITEGLLQEFWDFYPMGSKDAKSSNRLGMDTKALFKIYSLGIVTNRDVHVYSFDFAELYSRVNLFIDIYNSAVDKLKRLSDRVDISELINNNDARIKWTRQVKASLIRGNYSAFDESHVRKSIYRPFTKKLLYFDEFWNEERYKQHLFFPDSAAEAENVVMIVGGYGRKGFAVYVSNLIPNLNFYADPAQCFSYYVYSEDGSNRRENITDWALSQFQVKYGNQVTKWDIFHYIYGLLHHPQYRERYAENLKHDLPHIPLVHSGDVFSACVGIGKQLTKMHINYEAVEEYPLKFQDNESEFFSWRVEKMRLTSNRTALIVNESLTLDGIPQTCFLYRLGNRSALEWIIDQYQVTKDKRSGIESDPNQLNDEEYIVRLVCKVVQVSVETVRLVNELTQNVAVEDWTKESINLNEVAEI